MCAFDNGSLLQLYNNLDCRYKMFVLKMKCNSVMSDPGGSGFSASKLLPQEMVFGTQNGCFWDDFLWSKLESVGILFWKI